MALTKTLRKAAGRILGAAARAVAPPAPRRARRAAAVTEEQVLAAAQRIVATAMERGQHIRSATGAAPESVAGAGWMLNIPDLLRTDDEQQKIWGSEDAMYGRASTAYGPTPQALTSLSATDLTVERLAFIHREVDQQGLLTRKADLDFEILRRDGHLYNVHRQLVSTVYRTPLQFKPRTAGSDVSTAVCNFVRKVVDDIPAFSKAEEDLLLAAPFGFSAEEIIYKTPRPITFALGNKSVTVKNAKGVAGLEWVHNRDFRWHWMERRFLLDTGGARYIDPFTNPDGEPTRKLIMHEGYGPGDPHQRGYMYPASYLSMFKSQSLARWMVMLELFGIATPYMQFDEAGYASQEDVNAALNFLSDLGRGRPALLNRKYGEVKITETPQGINAQGQHAAILGWINAELSKLGAGQTLTMEIGGTGSYGAANVHENRLEDVQVIIVRQAAETMEHQLVVYIVEENAEQLANALGCTPDQVRAEVPHAYRVIDKRVDPVARLKMFIDGRKELKLKIDDEQIAEECNFRLVPDAKEEVAKATPLGLTPTDIGAIVTVNQALASVELPPKALPDGSPDPDGELTIAEFKDKHAPVVAAAAAAEDGKEDPADPTTSPGEDEADAK